METSYFPSVKPANPGDNQYYINLLHMYLPPLQRKMDVLTVASHLAQAGLLRIDEVEEIQNRVSRDRKSAALNLMKKLTKSHDPNWFSKFKTALEKSGQKIIYRLLNDGEGGVENEEEYEELLLMNFVNLTNQIKPMQLLPWLLQKETITKSDFDAIAAETKNNGDSRGVIKLLTLIPCRKDGWFTDFIAALKEENYRNVLMLFGSKFLEASSEESISRHAVDAVERLVAQKSSERQNTAEKRSVDQTQKSRDSVATKLKDTRANDETPSPSKNTVDILSDTGERAIKQLEAQEPETSQPFDFKEDDELTTSSLCDESVSSASHSSRPVEQGQQSQGHGSSAKHRSMSNAEQSARNISGSAQRSESGHSSMGASGLHSMIDLHSDLSVVDGSKSSAGQINQLSGTSTDGPNLQKLPSLSSSTNLFATFDEDNENTITEDDLPVAKKDLVLRGYQKELAVKAIEGKNCLIVAPTGSGKTHVALFISKHHLDCLEEDRKVLFFVPKVALVLQQRRQYLTYMEDNCRVTQVSGERDMQMTLPNLIERNEVIVLTPQILLNAIEEGIMDDSFSQFTLMIFDECHHATKDHPYNKIMSKFNDILLSGDEQKIHRLPQVVGLTASPGVGKALSDDAAMDHILRLCANLAISDICTVTDKENLKELQRNVNVAVEGIEEVRGRVNDPFEAAISKIMAEIENKMRNRKDLQSLVAEAPNIMKVLEPPAQRGHDSYTQFLAHLKREIAKIYNQEVRRFFLTCQEHLEVYNSALLINSDCRTIEAIDFIKDQFVEMDAGRRSSLPMNDVDRWLNSLFNGKVMALEEMSRRRDAENPKLKYLEQLILGFYEENRDSQGIIFCKTRYMTDALTKWIKETDRLKFLNPHNLVGAGSTLAKGNVSMTHHKLEDVLKFFKNGIHKIIIATSVAEEGLDVKSCNYVIRYEHVTNDIARVQSRGRARADDAKYVLVGERGKGAQHREATNQLREELMSRAIFLLHQFTDDEFKTKILSHQMSAKHERDLAAAAKLSDAHYKQMRSHEDDFQLRCFKCDSFCVWCSDLRTIKSNHHAIIDPEFKQRITTENHPRPKRYDDFEKKGKINCRSCGYDWGISALYKNIPIYLIKICSFVVEDQRQVRYPCKKWKDAPFQVKELLPEDMQALVSVFSPSD